MSLHSNTHTVVSGLGPHPSPSELVEFPVFSGLSFYLQIIGGEEKVAIADGWINAVYLKELNKAKCHAWLNNSESIMETRAVQETVSRVRAWLDDVE